MNKRIFTTCAAIAVCLSCFAAKQDVIKVKAVFSDGEKALWPVVEPRVSSTAKTASFQGEETVLTLAEGGRAFRAKAERGLTINSKAGLRMAVSDGDYLALPVINGMALTKVSVVYGMNGKSGDPSVKTGDGADIAGGEEIEGSRLSGDLMEWNLSKVKPGTECRIVFDGTGNFAIREIELTYAGTLPKEKKAKASKSKQKVVEVNFQDKDGNPDWPFSQKKLSYGSNTTEADLLTYNLDEFTIKCSQKAYFSSKGTLNFGDSKYDYIMFPSFKTKSLVKVEVTAARNGSNGHPAIMRQNSWKVVEGGQAATAMKSSEAYVWELSGVEAGERCRFVLTGDGNCQISRIVLYYE